MRRLILAAALAAALHAPHALRAQEPTRSIDLTVNGTGISIGDSRSVNGLRLNFRDTRLERVNGVNITIWQPARTSRGIVNGVAIGVPVTGAREITGLGVGIAGVGVEERFRGVGVGGLGVGGGGMLEGILVGGLGVGSGGGVRGIAIGGLGVGSGGDITGLFIGGLGVGGGGDVRGISIGGLGVGGGGSITGLNIGGLGVGGGGEIRGINIGGIGVGGGGGVTGVSVGGIGIGTGGTIRGFQVGGVGVGAPRVEGITLAGAMAGAEHMRGLVIAPGYVRIDAGGRQGAEREAASLVGASVSAINHIKGTQHGLAIGLVNYAWTLNGVQIGVLNYARNNPRGLRLLPIANVNIR